ncbi:endonuclease III domain-containing protein [Nafulsella turpanensis]|uniref:endonuclease III domain-containing protein n=1 Tax=Nafulsella turpanensis TaxID=1265690 RepID=UPI00034607F9|nr:endonuclease III [Nafulsella turpanensis]
MSTSDKAPFDIDKALEQIEKAVAPYPKAALFDLYEQGFTSLFEQLIACIISIRTFDEVTIPTAEKLFSLARTPEAMQQLSPEQIGAALHGATFAEAKSYQIKAIATEIVERHGGELKADFETLTAFKGVGPKCANLALGIAAGQAHIGVDIHVHRVTNRWGYIEAPTPEKTMKALEKKLPEKYWITINRLLVPFGKHICTGRLPHCSTCPVEKMCRQVGVTRHR